MKKILYIALLLISLSSCREEVTIFLPEHVSVAQPEFTDIEGFYLLCEGNMGWNKATLDYYDYASGDYIRNIFSYANPTVPKEMGDVGNDLGIYGMPVPSMPADSRYDLMGRKASDGARGIIIVDGKKKVVK